VQKKSGFQHTAVSVAVSTLLFAPLTITNADTEKENTGPQTMECVEVVAKAMLGPDTACEIAENHHRLEQYPEAVFLCDFEEEFDCANPENPMPCAVKGKLVGTISYEDEDGEEVVIDFAAGAKCGFTFNDLVADLSASGFQQFTARTNLGVFLDTQEIPEPAPGQDHPKPDFGLFLSDSGVAGPENYVSQRMALTGARKIPSGSKGALDMVGDPPARDVVGTLCGPDLKDKLERIAAKKEGDHGDDDKGEGGEDEE
jgi:hypothetical protein